jgi:NADPH:quinone reductase-like Zn-dependent oxidoreductase
MAWSGSARLAESTVLTRRSDQVVDRILSKPSRSRKLLPFLASRSKDDLILLKEMIEAGKVTPVIDRCYPLSETADAMRYLEEGHVRGKVVITV